LNFCQHISLFFFSNVYYHASVVILLIFLFTRFSKLVPEVRVDFSNKGISMKGCGQLIQTCIIPKFCTFLPGDSKYMLGNRPGNLCFR